MTNLARSIMVVDDVKQRRNLLLSMLDERDYRLFAAESTEQALQLFQQKVPDLIITETELPARSGLFLLQEVKRQELATEVILLTHNASSYNLLQALRLGALDFIVRPIDTSEILFSVVDRAFGQIDLRQENQGLLNELQQKNQALAQSLEMMKALNVSIERVNRAHEVGELLSQLLDAALDALHAVSGMVALQNGKQESFGIKISRGILPAFSKACHEELPGGLLLDTARKGNPLLVPDKLPVELANQASDTERLILKDDGLLAVPLHHRHRTIGMLALFGHRDGSPFTEQNLHFLIQLAHHAALALEKAGIIHQLKRRDKNGI